MIYFDVGANDGSSSYQWARQGSTVFAFEPNPEMIEAIKARVGANPNYIIMPFAVSDYNGTAIFNICKTHDRGCSSLLDVSEAGKTEWGGRQDMLPAETLNVNVMRLDSLSILDQISSIEFFHCDAQGSDLKVLQGLGRHISKIQAGVCEAGTKPDILYKGQNTLETTRAYLESNGFEITGITTNDVQNNEVNLAFRKKFEKHVDFCM